MRIRLSKATMTTSNGRHLCLTSERTTEHGARAL